MLLLCSLQGLCACCHPFDNPHIDVNIRRAPCVVCLLMHSIVGLSKAVGQLAHLYCSFEVLWPRAHSSTIKYTVSMPLDSVLVCTVSGH